MPPQISDIIDRSTIARTVENFCLISGLGKSFVYAEIKAGRLHAHKAGRRTLILNTDGDAYLRSLPSAAQNAGGIHEAA